MGCLSHCLTVNQRKHLQATRRRKAYKTAPNVYRAAASQAGIYVPSPICSFLLYLFVFVVPYTLCFSRISAKNMKRLAKSRATEYNHSIQYPSIAAAITVTVLQSAQRHYAFGRFFIIYGPSGEGATTRDAERRPSFYVWR